MLFLQSVENLLDIIVPHSTKLSLNKTWGFSHLSNSTIDPLMYDNQNVQMYTVAIQMMNQNRNFFLPLFFFKQADYCHTMRLSLISQEAGDS